MNPPMRRIQIQLFESHPMAVSLCERPQLVVVTGVDLDAVGIWA